MTASVRRSKRIGLKLAGVLPQDEAVYRLRLRQAKPDASPAGAAGIMQT
ncbi:MAG: hypothetical protein ACLU9S_13790 [Oscillospiraceae bacterium]